MRRFLCTLAAVGIGLFGFLSLGAAEDPAPAKLPLVFSDQFDQGAGHWQPTDPAAWKVIDTPQGKAYSLFKQSKYKPPHRSPFNFSLVKDVVVSDFVLEAKVQTTARDYPHRDMCIIFGYQDPAHFYYAHLGQRTDDHANQVFIVNKADRTKISTETTAGTKWDSAWHPVKVVRTVATGAIAVYFDDLKNPAMTATDKTFTWGQVGLGSFDDTGNWADVKLFGTKVARPKDPRGKSD
jgi:hypothetical protein